MKRLLIVGAGPTGIEAALLGHERGFAVTVLEAGRVGEGLLRWGATRAFSPLAMNLSARLRSRLTLPVTDDALLSGPELAALLSQIATQLGGVHEHTRVVSIARARMGRLELAGHPVRGERPFRVIVEHEGQERAIEADRVLDASGVSLHVPLGARGERALANDPRVLRTLGALHEALPRLRDQRVAIVGAGHSAAHAVGLLAPVAKLTWIVRTARARPVQEVASDPLPERARVVERANELATTIDIERRASIESVTPSLHVALNDGRALDVDALVVLSGQRPDLSTTQELALDIAPASEGSGRLWRAISNVTDCLSVPTVPPDMLDSGEPGFHLIGSKSYGRARTFLLQTGLQQLEAIFSRL